MMYKDESEEKEEIVNVCSLLHVMQIKCIMVNDSDVHTLMKREITDGKKSLFSKFI